MRTKILICILFFFLSMVLIMEVYAASRVFFQGFENNLDGFEDDGYRGIRTTDNPKNGKYCGMGNWGDMGLDTPDYFKYFKIAKWDYENEFFVRLYVRIGENCEPKNGPKIWRFFPHPSPYNGYGAADFSNGGMAFHNWEGVENCTCYDIPLSYFDDNGRKVWKKVEIYLKHDTNDRDGVIKVWIDDVLSSCINDSNKNFLKANNFDGSQKWFPLYFPSNWSSHDGEWREDNENSVFFDNIEIYSDIGSGAKGSMVEGTIRILDAPTGLRIIKQK